MEFHIINNYNSKYQFHSDNILKILATINKHEIRKIQSVNLIFTDDEHMRELKNKYFNEDYYTDVISFTLEENQNNVEGEIYIGMSQIIKNSSLFKCSLNNELQRIIIHGCLHLIGYDDQNDQDKKNMTNLENKYIDILNDIILVSE